MNLRYMGLNHRFYVDQGRGAAFIDLYNSDMGRCTCYTNDFGYNNKDEFEEALLDMIRQPRLNRRTWRQ